MLNTRSIVDFKCNLSLYLFLTDYKTRLKKVGGAFNYIILFPWFTEQSKSIRSLNVDIAPACG